jgi:hypothetical protein
MNKILIEDGYRVVLPPEVQSLVHIGASVWVTVDQAGRIVLTPEGQAQAALLETFGMWADRADTPSDGVTYMNQVRRGRRLNELGLTPDETD